LKFRVVKTPAPVVEEPEVVLTVLAVLELLVVVEVWVLLELWLFEIETVGPMLVAEIVAEVVEVVGVVDVVVVVDVPDMVPDPTIITGNGNPTRSRLKQPTGTGPV
jgi:hypothetical protein